MNVGRKISVFVSKGLKGEVLIGDRIHTQIHSKQLENYQKKRRSFVWNCKTGEVVKELSSSHLPDMTEAGGDHRPTPVMMSLVSSAKVNSYMSDKVNPRKLDDAEQKKN